MSLQMRAVAAYVRLTYKKRHATTAGARRLLAAAKGESAPPARLRSRHQVCSRKVAGFDCWTVTPTGRAAERVVVYVHGGAYVSEIVAQHWGLISRLADAGVRVEVPLYGLAPQRLGRRRADPRVRADPRRGGAAAGAPTGAHRPVAGHHHVQPCHSRCRGSRSDAGWVGAVEIGRAWAGGDDPADPRLSPINGSLTGLPPLDVYAGTRDLLLPDMLRLQERAAAEEVTMRLTVCDGAVHVYPLTPTPEGRAAAAAIVKEIAG
ncbi:alpha/beta hydrolase [Actinopolymorpha pittospori]